MCFIPLCDAAGVNREPYSRLPGTKRQRKYSLRISPFRRRTRIEALGMRPLGLALCHSLRERASFLSEMKIATFNVNGIASRLPRLLEWLEKESPDIACLQELKAPDEAFPILPIQALGYGAVWHGQRSWNGVAILAKNEQPTEIRRGLPGDPDDTHSRYIEARAKGIIVASLYLPNGNPQPGPKFDYKLAWFERLIEHASTLYDCGEPVVLAGDYNV